MDRNEILERLRAFPYDPAEYWVVTGGAMVLHGVREETSDIDLGCSRQLADRLESEGYLFRYTEAGNRWFRYGDSIEIFENWLCGSVETVEGFQAVSLAGLIEMKQEIGREKDLEDIRRIREFMDRRQ